MRKLALNWRDNHMRRRPFGFPNFRQVVGGEEPVRVFGQSACGGWKACNAWKRSGRQPHAFAAGGATLRGGRDLPPLLSCWSKRCPGCGAHAFARIGPMRAVPAPC